jgi:hypothetical protein
MNYTHILIAIIYFGFAANCQINIITLPQFSTESSQIKPAPPTCSSTGINAALVYYPIDPNQSCSAVNASFSPDSIWIGARFGECNKLFLCGTDCSIFNECASYGYTFAELNDCYSSQGICDELPPGNFQTFMMLPNGPNSVTFFQFSDAVCGTLATSNNITIDSCLTTTFICSYGTTAIKLVPSCDEATTT